MKRLGIELTDRCNLACAHCLREINHDRTNIDTSLVRKSLQDAAKLGFREVVFTGGEPTLHPDFAVLVSHAVSQGFQVKVVSNGQRPAPLWASLAAAGVREKLTISLSLEAADEAAFDAVRGKHAYRRFMQTVAGLQVRGAVTIFSVTIGPWNRQQWPHILALAAQLGISGVSVASYQPTDRGLPGYGGIDQLRQLHEEIEAAASASAVPVTLSYEPLTKRALHLCSTLALQDLNVNHRGEVTFCCQLSTLYHAKQPSAVVVAHLSDGVAAAAAAQARNVAAFLENKLHAWRDGPPRPSDEHPCLYCLRTFGQVAWEHSKNAA